jgi:tripartite-type tricarboxylate transporter receptor subunit TctC
MNPKRCHATRRQACLALLWTPLLAAAPHVAQAQEAFPTRPITIIVGYTPGGANDVLARIVAEKMATILKQAVVVENRPGVASIVGASFVAKARADGYTLLMGASGPMSFNPSLYKQLPYAPDKDFAPISLVATFPLVLLTQASNPATATLPALLQYAKANPGTINYSSSAASFQLITELFKRQSGTSFTHIPYKGSNDATTAVATGDATMTLVDSGPALTAVRVGKVRPLAITSPTRSPYFPGTPTMKELGVDMEVELWSGLFAPTGTPPAVIQKLEQAVRETVDSPDVQQHIKDLAMNPRSSSAQELGRRVHAEIEQWRTVATSARIEPN